MTEKFVKIKKQVLLIEKNGTIVLINGGSVIKNFKEIRKLWQEKNDNKGVDFGSRL